MRLLSAFLNILRIDTAPTPKPAEPPVSAEALLDLALVMRERWEGTALSGPGYESHGLVAAALHRIFPGDVHTFERCAVPECQLNGCDECATDAQVKAGDDKLTDFLAGIARPSFAPIDDEFTPMEWTAGIPAVAAALPATYFGVYGENGKRWTVAGEGFEMKPEGHLTARQAHAMCVVAAHALNEARGQAPR